MNGSYNYWLVALSLVIAIFASYAALSLAGRIAAAAGRARIAWLAGGAASMGLGIWAMHFVGMVALKLPVPVFEHVPTVFVSLLAAVFASGVSLLVVSRKRWNWPASIAGSVVMGGGIASMHYIGMAAMRLPAMMHWNYGIVWLSVVIAIVVSLVALWLMFRFRGETRDLAPLRVASAAVMGFAVVAMHYTGMAAVTFMPSTEPVDLTNAEDIASIGLTGVVLVTLVVLAFASTTSLTGC